MMPGTSSIRPTTIIVVPVTAAPINRTHANNLATNIGLTTFIRDIRSSRYEHDVQTAYQTKVTGFRMGAMVEVLARPAELSAISVVPASARAPSCGLVRLCYKAWV